MRSSGAGGNFWIEREEERNKLKLGFYGQSVDWVGLSPVAGESS